MMRIDRQRLVGATFPERREFPIRFDDLDVQTHVNNVAVAVLLQEARVTFHRSRITHFLGDGRSIVVGSLFIDYAGQMHYPQPVEIGTGVLEISRVSYTLGHVISQHDRPGVFAEATLVYAENGRAATIPDAMRSVLESSMILSTEAGSG